MSYILDALKKADRERSRVKVPTLSTVHVPVYASGRRVVVWVLGVILVSGSALALWLWRPDALQGHSTLPPHPSVEAAPSVASPLPPREPAAPAPFPPAAPPAPAMKAESRLEAPQEPAPKSSPRAIAPPGPSAPVTGMTSPPAAAPTQSGSKGGADSAKFELTPKEFPAPGGAIPSRPETTSSSPSPANGPTLRQAVAKMTLGVFVYAENEADRMVVINGHRYFRGQLVDGLYLVEDITPDGVVLSYKGDRETLRP